MKQLIIMRGLPGSGKSTLAKTFGGVICSADQYFTDFFGRYKFDASKLTEAHEACFRKAEKAMSKGVKKLIVDNTNTRKWEFEPYLAIAEIRLRGKV